MQSPLTGPSCFEEAVVAGLLNESWRPYQISGGRTSWTHHKQCKTQYEYSKMKVLWVVASPGPMAYTAIDGVAPEKCWKTKKHFFQAPY